MKPNAKTVADNSPRIIGKEDPNRYDYIIEEFP